jgi:nicotinate-nucleotide--dimethylbenzimidazole phosphoribosyltransferase
MTIPIYNDAARRASVEHQGLLTKPPGSLGRLEELAAWYAGALGVFPPPPVKPAILVFAADHGVAEEGVSAYPSVVTHAMVQNMARGGAAVNVLAVLLHANLFLTNVGVHGSVDEPIGSKVPIRQRVVREGSRNFLKGKALTGAEVAAAVRVGRETAAEAIACGATIIAVGEMGIGNTTAASAIVAALTGVEAIDATGRGTGVSDETLRRKVDVVRRALALHQPVADNPLWAYEAFGGLEMAAMSGAMLEAAARQVPVMLDGFLAGASALVARAVDLRVVPYLAASHESAEQAARHELRMLGKEPYLRLNLRLGEGTGALLGIMLLQAAVACQTQMATFESASVPVAVANS